MSNENDRCDRWSEQPSPWCAGSARDLDKCHVHGGKFTSSGEEAE